MKTSLVAVSTLCLSQIEHEIQNSTYCSQFELSRCSKNPTCCCEYSLCQGLNNPSLLIAARITLVTASTSYLKQPNTYSRAGITIHCPCLLVALRSILTATSLLNHHSSTNPNPLAAARSNLDVARSTHSCKHFYHETTIFFQ